MVFIVRPTRSMAHPCRVRIVATGRATIDAVGTPLEDRGVSRRESEVLAELGDRRTNAEIAARLFISERTVESHVSALLRKLQSANRLELSDIARSLLADVDVRRLPAPLELAAESSTLVGRQPELDELLRVWRRVCVGETLVTVVTGEAGIGKSRLVAELAGVAHRDGGRVVLGACFEDTQTPYEPFVRAILDDVENLADDEVIRRAGRRRRLLARLVPDLRGLLGVDVEDSARIEDMRADLLDAVYGYFARSTDHGPVVLVIEDLHFATATTRNVVQHIARTGGHGPLLVLVTARDSRPDADDDLRDLLGALDRMPAVERVALSGLTDAEVDELVDQVSTDSAIPSAAVADARGNPLFIREIAVAGSAGSGASINGLLLRRFARLEPDERAVVNAASVIGAEFDSVLLSTCAERPLLEILEVLDRAVAAGLVASSPDPRGRFSFAHPLLRTACYGALRSADRVALHHRVAVALEQRYDDTLASELARHACISAPLFDPRLAAELAMRAARLAESSLALDEAIHHCRDALEVAQLAEPDRRRILLQARILLARLLQRTGHPESRQLLLDAAGTARELRSALALAEITWAMAHDGSTTTPGAMDPEFVLIAEDALAGLGDQAPAWRARVLAALSTHHAVGGDPQRGAALSDEALEIARRLDDRVTLGFVLLARRYSGGTPLRPEQRLAIGDELVGLGALTATPLFSVFGYSTVLWSYRELGQLDAHDVALDAFEAALGDHNLAYARLLLELGRANQRHLRGDLAEALQRVEAAIALTPAAGIDAMSFCGPLLNAIRHAQGRIGELAGLIERATVTQPGFRGTYDAALAIAYSHATRLDDARAIIDRYANDDFEGVSPNLAMTSGLVLFADAAEITEHVAASRQLLIALEPHRELLADNGGSVRGSVDLAIAQCALTIGDPAHAAAVAGRAVLASRNRGTPIFLARELIRLAVARQQLGAGNGEVEPLVTEALDLASRTGAELVVQELRRYRLAG
jgi:DNA-binding CsgD family transcriptional regulator/tetratricopeptide (TPR) repeat protein/energy-coupling factor transporter ATP-binding protein EcfA2